MGGLREFQGSSNVCSQKFEWLFWEVLRKFQMCFKKVQRCFKKILKVGTDKFQGFFMGSWIHMQAGHTYRESLSLI